MMQRPSRPAGVTILAVLEILIGIIGLLASLAIIGLSALASTIPAIGGLVGTIGLAVGGVALFFSVIWLATGIGFLHGRGWAWTLGMVFSVLSLLGSVAVLAVGLVTDAIIGIFFWSLMLYYLTRSHVKVFFGKGGLPVNGSYPIAYPARPGFTQQPMVTNIPSYAQTAPPSISLTPPTLQTVGSSAPVSQLANGQNGQASGTEAGPKAMVSCPYCGSRLTMGSPKCLTCGATI
jgi:hypothetical protein